MQESDSNLYKILSSIYNTDKELWKNLKTSFDHIGIIREDVKNIPSKFILTKVNKDSFETPSSQFALFEKDNGQLGDIITVPNYVKKIIPFTRSNSDYLVEWNKNVVTFTHNLNTFELETIYIRKIINVLVKNKDEEMEEQEHVIIYNSLIPRLINKNEVQFEIPKNIDLSDGRWELVIIQGAGYTLPTEERINEIISESGVLINKAFLTLNSNVLRLSGINDEIDEKIQELESGSVKGFKHWQDLSYLNEEISRLENAIGNTMPD